LQELATEPQAVYKLHGRVMVKQDVSEARSTVASRLDFIQKEL
jgi:chaperonin cofactor prefoldin